MMVAKLPVVEWRASFLGIETQADTPSAKTSRYEVKSNGAGSRSAVGLCERLFVLGPV